MKMHFDITNALSNFFGKVSFVAFIIFFGSFAVASAQTDEPRAGEIHYSGVADVRGDDVVIRYRGPWGEKNFTCSLSSGECGDGNTLDETGTVLNTITSPDGNFKLKTRAFGFGGSPTVYYSVYDISGNEESFRGLVPFYEPASEKRFSADSERVVFLGQSGKVVTYDVSSKTKTETTILGLSSNLPLFLFSPSGDFASSYNYGVEAHRIYDFENGTTLNVPGGQASYLEFSDESRRGAFADNSGNFEALRVVDFSNGSAQTSTVADGQNGEYDIEDYIFVGGKLYYMANKENPITWGIYEYDFDENTTTQIAENVSFGEYLKRADGKLLYQKVNGKNANMVSYDPETGESNEFEPVPASQAASDVNREIVTLESGRTGVLLTPAGETESDNVFIWLHGGPMRQVAVGYHSYLSYGAYDELLERLVSGGNTVLKLDYTGSRGYGNELQEGLDKKVGVADVDDVLSAARELHGDRDYDNTYLIGNSYGGYLALRSLNQAQDMFDGAISIAGVTDWYGLISRIPSSPFKKLFHGVPDTDNLDAYMEASIYGGIPELDASKKIMMVYGELDNQVPTWQSKEFIEFARKFDVDVETLVFDDEGHVLKKRDNLDELCERITSDFNIDGVSCEVN